MPQFSMGIVAYFYVLVRGFAVFSVSSQIVVASAAISFI